MGNGKSWVEPMDERFEKTGSCGRQIGNGDDNHASQVTSKHKAIVEASVYSSFRRRPVDGLLQLDRFSSMATVTSRQLHNLVPEATIQGPWMGGSIDR